MEYTFHDTLIIRTPLRPFQSSFSEDELVSLFSQKAIQEALFLASPNLLDEFCKWQSGAFEGEERKQKLVFSLQKYALRMHNRCTPFGLFAKCGIVRWGDNNQIIQLPENRYRKTRLDMHFSCNLASEISRLPHVRTHLKFFPNNSLYNVGRRFRYVEYTYVDGKRNYQISAVDHSEYIDLVLQDARNGASIQQLAAILMQYDAELSVTETKQFIEELIDAQLLVSELEPTVSGSEVMVMLVNRLTSIQQQADSEELSNLVDFLEKTSRKLGQIDMNLFNEIGHYTELQEFLKTSSIPFELGKLFQTDLFITASPENQTIDQAFQGQLKTVVRVLNRLTVKPDKTHLSEFKRQFYERYENAELPLLTVLDNESGIGYAGNSNHTGDTSPLIRDFPVNSKISNGFEMVWDQRESFLLHKLTQALKVNAQVVHIGLHELDSFPENWTDLPDTFPVQFNHTGNQLLIKGIGGSSGVNMLGRFTTGNEQIRTMVEEIASYEQALHPEKILAEIVHLPENRTGNVLLRSSFRKYEIPYLAQSELPDEQQIDLSDLYVSIQNDELVLRSARLNKEILPRLGNAHNYSFNSLPVYHFLSDLQYTGKRSGVSFDWGKLQNEFSFLPRVEVGTVIVSLATWNVNKIVIKKLDSPESLLEWKQANQLPDLVLLVESDNEMLINFGDNLSLQGFLMQIKNKSSFTLKEFIFSPETALVKDDNEKSYTNEFIAILQRKETPVAMERAFVQRTDTAVPRTFVPGSEWLYYKLYCGIKTADEILTDVLQPLSENLINENRIDSWFFIRYSDPDPHLRIRFHIPDASNVGRVIELFREYLQSYIDQNLIWSIQLDTYQREIERYGESTMLLSEQLFFQDSLAAVQLLNLLGPDENGQQLRWLSALRSVDNLLNDFRFNLQEKRDLMHYLKTAFGQEFNVNKQLNKLIDKKYRSVQREIEEILNTSSDKTNEWYPIITLLEQKSAGIQSIAAELLRLNATDSALGKENLVSSYIHMLLNRLIKNKQRMHEWILYDFLYRTYKSQCARAGLKESAAAMLGSE